MKKYIVTYTKDYGITYECQEVDSESYTVAYVSVDMTLPAYASITSVTQVNLHNLCDIRSS